MPLEKFPINRRHQRLATLLGEQLVTYTIKDGFQSIGVTKDLRPVSVTARKDDAPAADQAAIINLADLAPFSGGGGSIQTTSG